MCNSNSGMSNNELTRTTVPVKSRVGPGATSTGLACMGSSGDVSWAITSAVADTESWRDLLIVSCFKRSFFFLVDFVYCKVKDDQEELVCIMYRSANETPIHEKTNVQEKTKQRSSDTDHGQRIAESRTGEVRTAMIASRAFGEVLYSRAKLWSSASVCLMGNRLSLLSFQINDKQNIYSFGNRLSTFGRVSGVRFLFNHRLAVGK